MAEFTVTVGGKDYDVTAPDERTAWKWANATHLQGIKNDGPAPAAAPAPKRDDMSRVADKRDQVPYDTGAKVNDFAAKYLPAPFAAGLGAATNAGLEGAQMVASGGAGVLAGAAAKPVLQDTARWTMQKALKPTVTDFRKGKGDRAIETLLEEGVNVSRGGVEKLRDIGEGLNQKVAAELANSTAAVPKNDAASRILDRINTLEASNPLPNSQRAAMEGVYDEFASNPLVAQNIPLTKAQTYKQTLYQGLKDNYGKLSEGDEAARKALALGLKEEIELGAPAVAPLNKRASDIWNALNVTERRAYVGGNNNPVSLPTAVGMLHNPAFGAGMIVNTSDLAKSLIARGLYQTGRAAPYLGGAAGMASALRESE